ncbi:hypothetical protein, partial [Candidatus Protofrankia californiensis]|uniref:hypothetical protein n=1 Tax=Candidatus Protofrankia californiensis TaxID=1839754 RepID=UPI0019D10232
MPTHDTPLPDSEHPGPARTAHGDDRHRGRDSRGNTTMDSAAMNGTATDSAAVNGTITDGTAMNGTAVNSAMAAAPEAVAVAVAVAASDPPSE